MKKNKRLFRLPDGTQITTDDQQALARSQELSNTLQKYAPGAQVEFTQLNEVIDSLTNAALARRDSIRAARKARRDSIRLARAGTDSTLQQTAPTTKDNKTDDDDGSFLGMSSKKWDEFQKIVGDEDLTYQQIEDSLHLAQEGFWAQLVTKQVHRVQEQDQSFFGYIIGNIPIMMFILLPLFALILKLLYIRRKWLYIKHLVHALHLHIFAYFIYGVTILITLNMLSDGATTLISLISFFLVTTYAYISFLKVYGQGWFKTLVKFNLLGFIYFVLLVSALASEVIISFLLF